MQRIPEIIKSWWYEYISGYPPKEPGEHVYGWWSNPTAKDPRDRGVHILLTEEGANRLLRKSGQSEK